MLTKKALFNAKNAGQKVEDGMIIEVANVGTFADKDKDGHDVTVSVLESKDGEVFTSISATIAQSIDMLDDILSDEGTVKVKVVQNTSNNGREFYQLQII